MDPSIIAIGVVLTGSAIAIATDLRGFRVYNALTFPMALGGLAFHSIFAGWSGLGMSVAGMLFGFVILFVPYLLGAMGAGDVKLLAAIGAWLGIVPTMYILMISLLFTAIYSLVMLFFVGRLRDAWTILQVAMFRFQTIGRHLIAADNQETVQALVAKPGNRHRLIPFSVMVGLGAMAILVWVRLTGS